MHPVTRILGAVALAATSFIPDASAACPSTECAPRCHMTDATIREWLPTLLRQEGLGNAATPLPFVRRVELDGDSNTEEAS